MSEFKITFSLGRNNFFFWLLNFVNYMFLYSITGMLLRHICLKQWWPLPWEKIPIKKRSGESTKVPCKYSFKWGGLYPFQRVYGTCFFLTDHALRQSVFSLISTYTSVSGTCFGYALFDELSNYKTNQLENKTMLFFPQMWTEASITGDYFFLLRLYCFQI